MAHLLTNELDTQVESIVLQPEEVSKQTQILTKTISSDVTGCFIISTCAGEERGPVVMISSVAVRTIECSTIGTVSCLTMR